jgi:hypothetical protein
MCNSVFSRMYAYTFPQNTCRKLVVRDQLCVYSIPRKMVRFEKETASQLAEKSPPPPPFQKHKRSLPYWK